MGLRNSLCYQGGMSYRNVALGLCLIVGGCTITRNYPPSGLERVGAEARLGIQVLGVGEAQAAPDVAMFQIGAEAHAASVEEARQAVMTSLQAVLGALAQAGVPPEALQTSQLTVTPDYTYSDQGRALKGYVVTNRVQVRVEELARLQPAIDLGLRAGGNAVWLDGLRFELSDASTVEGAARRLAMQNAKAKAEQLAQLLGVQLGRPLSVRDDSSQPGYPMPIAMREAKSAAVDTPVQPGLTAVQSRLQVEWEIIYPSD